MYTLNVLFQPTSSPSVSPTPKSSANLSLSPTATNDACGGNLLSNGNFEDGLTDWRAWVGASVELTMGATGSAIVAFGRDKWRSGPRQDLRDDDLTCLTPGTVATFEFKVKLVDNVKDLGVSCDPSTSFSCPIVLIMSIISTQHGIQTT